MEDKTDENGERKDRSQWAYQRMHVEFWEKVTAQYGLWGKNIGIRDGYAIALIPNVPSFVKGMMKELMDEIKPGEGFEIED